MSHLAIIRGAHDGTCDSEWMTHQHRDALSSIVGHPPLLSYLAVADGEAIGRVKFEMTEVFTPYGMWRLGGTLMR